MDIMLLVYFGLITIRKYVFLRSHFKSKYFVPDKYVKITGREFMTFTDITSKHQNVRHY